VKQALRDAKRTAPHPSWSCRAGSAKTLPTPKPTSAFWRHCATPSPGEELGVKLALENVWNHFLLSPLEAARFVDEFNSPAVGWHLTLAT